MTNQWINSQIAVLQRFANGLPDTLDEVTLALDKPEVGWIDMHFKINGGERLVINTSDVYDPFFPLRQWLEYLARNWQQRAASVLIDCEGYEVILSYQPFFCPEKDEAKMPNYPKDCGIFSIYNTLTEQTAATAYCDTIEFIGSLYKSLLDYVEENAHDPAFTDEWNFDNDITQATRDEFQQATLFMARVKSPVIENFLDKYSVINQRHRAKIKYQEQINQKLHESGFVEADLTEEEMDELIEEIKAEESSSTILDGVLFNKDIYNAHRFRRNRNSNDKE